MLKKIRDLIANPFEARRKPIASSVDETPADKHPHSFSCACKPCVDHTNALTRARLKAQGA
jgi:hypothetical protein